MPDGEKCMPTQKVQLEFRVQTNGVVPASETAEKVYHPARKGAPRLDHFSCLMQVAN